MTRAVLALLVALSQFALPDSGELRVVVTEPAGLAVPGPVVLESDLNQVRQRLETDAAGIATARRLPFGRYRVSVTRNGFAGFSGVVEIRSALPTEPRHAGSSRR